MPNRRIVVLIVEDEPLIRLNISEDLSELGFQVFEAADAREAVAVLARHPNINVLFTDIDMPGDLDGLRLAALVRNRWPLIRIIVTSGKHHLRSSELPVVGRFINKPYHSTSVAAAIDDLVAV